MKDTHIRLNGKDYRVSQSKKSKRFSIFELKAHRYPEEIATGDTLGLAISNNMELFNFEGLERKYRAEHNIPDDFETEEEQETFYKMFDAYVDNLDDETLFDEVKDGAYMDYVDWDKVEEDDDEDFDF